MDKTASKDDTPESYIHNYKFMRNGKGFYWDKNYEYYGSETLPPVTYDEISKNYMALIMGTAEPELKERYNAFTDILKKQNTLQGFYNEHFPVMMYFGVLAPFNAPQNKDIKYNGKYYGEEFDNRKNQMLIGEAKLKKHYAFFQDAWKMSDKTTLTPVIRLDHSDLFGSQITANLGLVHKFKPGRRLKFNVGTGYAEPGMGELYYNWEMFGGTGGTHLGWYWIGNPDLKPEKSLNIDVSIEGEDEKNYVRATLFHNHISNYITKYFTGQLIDFNFLGTSSTKTLDRIYSFQNIGKAEISGLEVETQHKFDDHWSAKLGYTWLHAINKSDSTMPRTLLDRPQHKVDFGLNYKNDKSGLRAALWGDYYLNMLDSNSVDTDNLYEQDENGNYIVKQGKYKKKNFGIWNFLVEKKLSKVTSAYIGVDNIFNHRDNDRAFQDRTYRSGINVKLDILGAGSQDPEKLIMSRELNANNVYGDDWFIAARKNHKKGAIQIIGDYRVRSNMFKGENKAEMRLTKETQASQEAAFNAADNAGHGFEQRLRLGIDAQLGENTNLLILGSTGKLDTRYNVSEKKGLHDVRLERAELSHSADKWDYTVGRINERIGATGYWFGKEYDGIRVVGTGKRTQLRMGYGDFKNSTGIQDSAYNHKIKAVFKRAPTLNELFGLYAGGHEHAGLPYPVPYSEDAQANYREKFNKAGEQETDPVKAAQAKLAVLNEFLNVARKIDSAGLDEIMMGDHKNLHWYNIDGKVKLSDGTEVDLTTINNSTITIAKLTSNSSLAPGEKSVFDYSEGQGVYGLLKEENIRTMLGDAYDRVNNYYNLPLIRKVGCWLRIRYLLWTELIMLRCATNSPTW